MAKARYEHDMWVVLVRTGGWSSNKWRAIALPLLKVTPKLIKTKGLSKYPYPSQYRKSDFHWEVFPSAELARQCRDHLNKISGVTEAMRQTAIARETSAKAAQNMKKILEGRTCG